MNELTAGSLLAPIKRATEHGRLEWEEDPTGGFVVVLGDNTVNLYEMNQVVSGSNRHRDAFTLRVLNVERKVVDFIEYDETNSAFEDAQTLYALVRRQVLKSDLVLGDILGRLTTAH